MQKEIINPWTWQDQFGFVHANVISGGQRVAYCAGQTSVDEDGAPVHAGDMSASSPRPSPTSKRSSRRAR